MADVTRILDAIESGDAGAADKLLPIVYDELRSLAARRLSHERPGQTLQPTALVHEAYIRLVGVEDRNWGNRAHFFAAAAEAMRCILIEMARRKQRLKRGGGRKRLELNDGDLISKATPDDLLALDEALAKLEEEDTVKANLVKLRYFAGLTVEQAAKALGVSRATADRYWAYARAWLYHEITKGDEPDNM
ncbi:MAG: sigma-70 family RNA polymerase sigma factor [Phycisphaerales bacterium]|nr:MAG: sigma-70 family RNA polymerase sigma factor [Phycisphaerales bacterium]